MAALPMMADPLEGKRAPLVFRLRQNREEQEASQWSASAQAAERTSGRVRGCGREGGEGFSVPVDAAHLDNRGLGSSNANNVALPTLARQQPHGIDADVADREGDLAVGVRAARVVSVCDGVVSCGRQQQHWSARVDNGGSRRGTAALCAPSARAQLAAVDPNRVEILQEAQVVRVSALSPWGHEAKLCSLT